MVAQTDRRKHMHEVEKTKGRGQIVGQNVMRRIGHLHGC